MIYHQIQKLLQRIQYYVWVPILFLYLNSHATDVNQNLVHETDSIKKAVQQCTNDTTKFNVLLTYFWKYANINFVYAKPFGEWAYNIIKESKNLKALSDGYDIKGCIFEKEQKYDSAYPFFVKALALSKKIGYHPRTGWSYYHLALIQFAWGNTDSAFYYLKILYLFDVDKLYIQSACEVLNEIGYKYKKLGEYDSAWFYFNNMLLVSQKYKNTDQEIIADFSLFDFYSSIYDTKKELFYMNEALKIAENTNNEKAQLKIYFQIGDLFYLQKKNYEIALIYYMKVLEKCNDQSKFLKANTLNVIGNLYLDQGKDSLALIYIQRGLQLSKDINYKHQLSESYRNLGNVYKYQGNYSEAIVNYNRCFNLGCDVCPKVAFHGSLIDIADSYLKINNRAKALEYYNKSLKLAVDSKAEKETAISNLKLGNFYQSLDPRQSNQYYLAAYQSAKKSKDIKVLKSIADTLSSVYNKNKDFKNACEFMSIANTLQDSINKIDWQESMADWELRFEFEKINKENEAKTKLSDLEIKKQKVYRNAALVISGLLVILGLVIFVSYKRKKKDNNLLFEQKKQIEEKSDEILSQIEEITSQKEEIERISGELHETDQMKLRFFSNLSHEFRTPLTLILNPVRSLLKSNLFKGDDEKQLQYIYKNALKLNDLTNQIMDLQKLDAGKLQLFPEKSDIIEYCVGIVSSFESLCLKKNNIIQFHSNYKGVITLFDKDKIGKILSNLLSNAFKYCFEETVIRINADIKNSEFILVVQDSGIGIEAGYIKDVFNRYYQVPSGCQATGTGIGLAFVKELVSFMNGKVSIRSNVNVGTEVKIALPLNYLEIADYSELLLEIPKLQVKYREDVLSEFFVKQEHQNTVLLVEDNDELRDFITTLLQPDYNIYTAVDGRNGMQMAIENIPDIIISDVMMPYMNGFEMCFQLKKDIRTSHIPIILLTAKDNTESNLEGYHTGADDYIIKPFDNEILKLKIRNIISTLEASRKQFDFNSVLTNDSFKLGNTDKEFMKRCLEIIEKNIDNSSFSIELLADKMSFSSRNFYRKIKALTSQTPAEMVRTYRLHYAQQLLQNTKMKVFEIAMAVGYEDVNRFRQAFKKQFGYTPTKSLDPHFA